MGDGRGNAPLLLLWGTPAKRWGPLSLPHCREGVPQSDEKAVYRYRKAANQGDEDAQQRLEELE